MRVNPDFGVRLGQGLVAANQVARFLGDHNGGRVCIATDDRGHDRCVNYTQNVDSVYASLFVHHTVATDTHSTRSNRVITCFHYLSHERVYFGI